MKLEPIALDFEIFHRLGGYTIGLDTHGMPCTPNVWVRGWSPRPARKDSDLCTKFDQPCRST